MKKIFVTYGNKAYYNSLKRIKREAENLGIFDKILIFTENDVPDLIKNHPLFCEKRGGGYWIWKPWVCMEAAKYAESENDIIIYSDCGNTLYEDNEWYKLFNILKSTDGLFFYNGGKMESWTKKYVIEYYKNPLLNKNYQIIGSFFLFKVNQTKKNGVIEKWYEDTLSNPLLLSDVPESEKHKESALFIEHRHDQAVLSGVIYSRSEDNKISTLPEISESYKNGHQAVFNSRISDSGQRTKAIPRKKSILLLKKLIVNPYRKLYTHFLFRRWLKYSQNI